MYKFLVFTTIASALLHTVLSDVAQLSQDLQNKTHLDPINDEETFEDSRSNHEQGKRTILKPHLHNVAWAKHVVINPSGRRVVLGFSPVDLKLSPVIRPLRPGGYSYPKPGVQFRLRRPVRPILRPKPVYGPPKPGILAPSAPVPIRPVVGSQPPHVDVVHNELAPHLDHVHQGANHLHQHGDHLHFGVHQFPHLHLLGQAHLDHVHHVQVPHGGHFDSFNHVHQIPVAPALKPFVPSPTIFEVTKPNLGVLPFGAVFQTPVLKGLPPHVHLRPGAWPVATGPHVFPPHLHQVPAVPQSIHYHQPGLVDVHPGLLPVHHHGVPVAHAPRHHAVIAETHPGVVPVHEHGLHPVVGHHHHQAVPDVHPVVAEAQPGVPVHQHGIHPVADHHHHHQVVPDVHPEAPGVHQVVPAGYPGVFAQGNPPGTVVEYHGTGNVFPINGQWPILPQTPVNAVQPVLPQQPVLPAQQPHEQHDVQIPYLPANRPNFQQQLVANEDQGYLQQQDLNLHNNYQHFQQDFPNIQQFQPHEALQQDENVADNFEYDHNNAIQPGQSDLQFPLVLPQHPFLQDGRGFQGNSFQDNQQSEQIFKPSITLEPPYNK